VLVVDRDPATCAQLEELGRERLLAVVTAADVPQALAAATRGRFHAAFVDASNGVSVESALGLAAALRATPRHARLPLAYVSDNGRIELRVAAAHAGASLFLTKPIDGYAFGAAVDQLLALCHDERMRVLVVDDDEDFVAVVGEVLTDAGFLVRSVPDATALLETLDDVHPDLIVLDAMLPRVSGWDAIRVVRTTIEHRDVPIVFLTARTDLEARIAAFEAGADDYVGKPLVAEELLARMRVRLERRRLLREMIERDPLTRCLSRRALLDALASRLSEAKRHSRSLSIALIDVDRFKRINDQYGHLVGDRVLAALGRLLNARFRREDLRARWGGDEFVIVFPGAPAMTAAAVLSRVLDEFRTLPFRSDRGERFFVTLSAGIACFPLEGATVEALVRAADRRLYEAKTTGRSHVVAPAVG
jgi:diguanylate cyclase (GGDEF)-like protein